MLQPAARQADGTSTPVAITSFTAYRRVWTLAGDHRSGRRGDSLRLFQWRGRSRGSKEGFLRSIQSIPVGCPIERRSTLTISDVLSPWSGRSVGDGRFIERTRYNELNQVIETVRSQPFEYATRYYYDEVGNIVRRERDLVNADGSRPIPSVQVATFCYDSEFNVVQESVGGLDLDDHRVTTHHYGSSGEKLRTDMPRGNRLCFGYDKRLDLVSLTEGAGTSESSTIRCNRDSDGRIVQTIDARGTLRLTTGTDLGARWR